MAQVEKLLQGKILFYSCWSFERGLKGGLYFQQDCPCSSQSFKSPELCPSCWGGWKLTEVSGGCCRWCDYPHLGFLFLSVTGCDTPGLGPRWSLTASSSNTCNSVCQSWSPSSLCLAGVNFVSGFRRLCWLSGVVWWQRRMFRVSFLVPLPFSCPFLPSDFIVPCSSQHSYTVLFCCTEELLASSPLLLPWCKSRMVAEMQNWYQWNQVRWDSKGRDKTQCFSRDWVCQGGMMERNCSYLIHLLSPPALQSTWASAQMSLNVTWLRPGGHPVPCGLSGLQTEGTVMLLW